MVSHFDPRMGADRSVAYARVTHPLSQSGLTSARPNTQQSARNTMQTWEQEVAELQKKDAKKVDEDVKTLALKSIMQETWFGEAGVFRGGSFNLFSELRTSIINSLDDKVPVSMMKQCPSILSANMVQTLCTRD